MVELCWYQQASTSFISVDGHTEENGTELLNLKKTNNALDELEATVKTTTATNSRAASLRQQSFLFKNVTTTGSTIVLNDCLR